MKNPKMYLGVLVAIILVIAAIIALLPSNATAQGLVEYDLFCTEDAGAPPDPEVWDYDQLLEGFGYNTWEDNWGLFVSCTPKFKKSTGEFNKLRICALVYEDVQPSGYLDFGDIKLDEVCTTITQ